jgi:hypothetical protein
MLIAAIRYRKAPDTPVPTTVVSWCRPDEPLRTGPVSARMPSASSRLSTKTTLEWPSEKKNPTDNGRLPSAISLRVVLSMALMWSASKACRAPSVYAVNPIPAPNVCVPML